MEFFDTHSHYNDDEFNEDREDILNKIYSQGITRTVVIGYNIEKSKKAIEIANRYDYIYTAIGIHPNDIGGSKEGIIHQINQIEEMINTSNKIVAIGEIGLDFHWEKDKKDLQKFAFIKQIELANKNRFPIVIHTRDAISDTIELLRGDTIPKYSGIMHCCTLNKELIQTALDTGLYISFAGPVTYKNTKNTDLIKIIPDDKILIETDCPYLSPEPNRGKKNDSRNIKYIAQKIAQIRGISIEKISEITYNNALKVFNIINK